MQVNDAGIQKSGIGRKLFANVGLNLVSQIFLLLLNIVTAPYIVHHLGAELFGIVALVQSVAGFASVVNLGIGRALTKYVSELYWKDDTNGINDLFQTAWAVSIIAGLIGFLLLAGPSETIGGLFFRGGPQVSGELTSFAIYVAAVGLFSSMLLEATMAIPVAAQQFRIRAAIDILVGTIRALGSVVLLAFGFSVRSVLFVNLLANLIAVAAFLIASRQIIPQLKLYPRLNRTALKKLLRFSLPLMLAAVSSLLVTRLDRFLLAYYLPIAAVSFYTLPYSLAEKLSMAVSNVTSVVLPFSSELHAMNAHDKVQELYLRATKTLALMTLPVAVLLIAIPGEILHYWLGAEFARQGATSLALLALAMFLNSITAVPTVTALGIGRVWMCTAFGVATSVIDLTLNFLFIPRYGINGAALALFLSTLTISPLFVHVVNRILRLSSWQFIAKSMLGPVACGSVQYAILLGTRAYIDSLASLLLMSFISAASFGSLAWFALTRQERLTLVHIVTLKATRPT